MFYMSSVGVNRHRYQHECRHDETAEPGFFADTGLKMIESEVEQSGSDETRCYPSSGLDDGSVNDSERSEAGEQEVHG